MTDAYRTAGAEILVIMADNLPHVREYAERLTVPFPVLADPERVVYHAYQLEVQFLLQRTASAIVDRNGIIRYIKRATLPSKWLEESKELLESVQRIQADG